MRIQMNISNGGAVTGVCRVEIDGPPITDAHALNLAQLIMTSSYVATVFGPGPSSPTLDSLEVRDLTRTVPLI